MVNMKDIEEQIKELQAELEYYQKKVEKCAATLKKLIEISDLEFQKNQIGIQI